MRKTPLRIQTSMRFKPETLKILDHHAKERAVPRTYLLEEIISEWDAQQQQQDQASCDLTTRVANLEAALKIMVTG